LQLSPNEIKRRAIAFSSNWKDETRERAEAQTFWNEFFEVFGLNRRRVASFEEPVKRLSGKHGSIDLLWKRVLLVEHKSKGEDLDSAYTQGVEYFEGLTDEDLPKFILVSDFARFRLHDLEEKTSREFLLKDLHKNIDQFGFILGWRKQKVVDEDPVNIRAAELMGALHDALKDSGYSGHNLEVFLVRIMFCMFADDTGIFQPRDHFAYYLSERTSEDGSDVGSRLSEIFQVLDTEEVRRPKNLDEDLARLPYVNGRLFEEPLRIPSFDTEMRKQLLKCCHFDWSTVSPAIFGSLFQSVMDPQRRREIGGHYTSEGNILKVVGPLVLDELRAELARCGSNERKLKDLLTKISNLKFLDPACGCGNFLVITYRELRLLDTEIRRRLRDLSSDPSQTVLDIELEKMKNGIDVDAFYGIELEEFPARIAEVALWLVDHQMNVRLSEELGFHYVRLPLKKAPNITQGNALHIDWNQLLPRDRASYVLGNPPFAGAKLMTEAQREDMASVFLGIGESGLLDYVSAWYAKAAQYIQGTDIRVAFVSTKSITQGEQVGILWGLLLSKFKVRIQFAHRTFKWTNEASGQAAVHCVIIGFGLNEPSNPVIFDYHTPEGEAFRTEVKHINPYLVDAPDVLLLNRTTPLCDVPRVGIGNKPIDGGNYLFTENEKAAFLAKEPKAERYMRPWIGSDEFINGFQRYCLWLGEAAPEAIRDMPEVMKRVEAVKRFRLASRSPSTRKLAATPTRFHVENRPKSNYIVIPAVSSERRKYIPIGFLTPDFLCSNAVKIVPNATLYHFGVLTSWMHAAWTRRVSGRLKSDYQYSIGIVYNNFPWPKDPSHSQVRAVERCAQEVLDVRNAFVRSSLAALYDPLVMPKELVKAHDKLDLAVERCYRERPFKSELGRVRFLFSLYQTYSPTTAPLETYTYSEDDEAQEDS
jgi:hypothetical protein